MRKEEKGTQRYGILSIDVQIERISLYDSCQI
jgi:hypothetical protein